jgi:hypothetical protein
MENIHQQANRPFFFGLFFITSATLLLEILNTRLLSVVTWYHLSFFAVSMAMFGMAVGALWVYLQPRRFNPSFAFDHLYHYSILFAISVSLCHIVVISTSLNVREGWDLIKILVMAVITLTVAVPFFFSGVVVTIALTQIRGNSGLIYAVDLVGAALGSLFCLYILGALDISSATFATSAIALIGVLFFQQARGGKISPAWFAMIALLLIGALVNSQSINGFRVFSPKGNKIAYEDSYIESWTIHGQILLFPYEGPQSGPFFWGPGEGAPVMPDLQMQGLVIDGEAGTAVTEWDGNRDTLDWPRFDVTALPYHLRPESDVAVIGVGGGRDILTALWAKSASVTGIEINRAILDVIEKERRDFVNLANQPEVQFVHDEARSFLTRSDNSYDIIQMSLIDTWAATGAGAFTLSENGLYTTEGWQVFLDRLAPGGIFSVSRWYSPEALSETNRLISLATMALLNRGIENPGDHIALVSRLSVATLLVSPQPFEAADLDTIEEVATQYGFNILHSPRQQSSEALVRNIVSSSSAAELAEATEHDYLDFSPPTDSRPYFFNILKPRALVNAAGELGNLGIVAGGNLLATYTLMLLCGLALVGVVLVIFVPLLLAGMPAVPAGIFPSGLLYFACIGTGFMMVQIPLMQRFSVYLGHPVYAVAVLLFSMILAAGIGSFLSDKIQVNRQSRWTALLPATIVALLLVIYLISDWLIATTISQPLLIRCLLVIAMVSTVALPMGMCFPLGLRLFREYSDRCLPWLWGINGATGVLASVLAVAVSMWSSINTSLVVAMVCYALLAIPARRLQNALH